MRDGFASLALLLPLAGQILNFSGKSIGSYMLLYLIGYYIIAEDHVMNDIVKFRYIYLAVLLIADTADVYLFILAHNANTVLNSIAMYFTCWFGILALLGFGKTGFDQNNRVTQYLTGRSFLIYLFHFMWVIIILFYFSRVTGNTVVLVFGTVAGSLVLTVVTCEIIRRIPFLCFCFGVRTGNPRKKK